MKIVLSVIVAFFMVACSDSKETKKESSSIQETKTVVEEVSLKVTPKSSEKKEPVEEIVVEEVKKVIEVTPEPQNEVSKSVEVVKESVPKELVKVKEADGAKIFKACAGCHGNNAEKKALNKSQIIQGWGEDKTIAALKGYKDGSYGGAMKGVMKGQVTKLTDADIDAVAKYIASLHE